MIHVLHCHQEAWQWLKNFFVSTKGIIKMPLRSVPTQSSHEYASLFSTTPHSQTLRVSLSSPSNLAGAAVLPLFFQNPPENSLSYHWDVAGAAIFSFWNTLFLLSRLPTLSFLSQILSQNLLISSFPHLNAISESFFLNVPTEMLSSNPPSKCSPFSSQISMHFSSHPSPASRMSSF